MLVKRLGKKDNRFDVFVGKGWDNHVRVMVERKKEKNEITIISPEQHPAGRFLLKGIEHYFNRGK